NRVCLPRYATGGHQKPTGRGAEADPVPLFALCGDRSQWRSESYFGFGIYAQQKYRTTGYRYVAKSKRPAGGGEAYRHQLDTSSCRPLETSKVLSVRVS